MDADKVFYVLYIQQTMHESKLNRVIVFYDKDTLEPILAYQLGPRVNIPKSYRMLDMITITKHYLFMKLRELEALGILRPYGETVQEAAKPQNKPAS